MRYHGVDTLEKHGLATHKEASDLAKAVKQAFVNCYQHQKVGPILTKEMESWKGFAKPQGSAIDNQTGECVPLLRTPGGNDTVGTENATDTIPQPSATDTTPPDIPPINLTQSLLAEASAAPSPSLLIKLEAITTLHEM